MVAKKVIEMANVVFKETRAGDKFEVLKTRDSQLKIGGVYSEDLVNFYAKTIDGVVVLNHSGEVVGEEAAGIMTAAYLYGQNGIAARNITEPAPEPLKVGDYVRFISPVDKHKKGDVRKIDEIDEDDEGLPLGFEGGGWAHYKYVEKLSEEEVVTFEKWASINRKPNEFKKGDIVCSGIKVGEVTERAGSNGRLRVENGRDWWYVSVKNLLLITPVEARFDLSSEGDR